MVILDCADVATACLAVEVLGSASLRIKPGRGRVGSAGGSTHFKLLREGCRVYVGELPGAEAMDCDLLTLVSQFLPRHLAMNLTITPFAAPVD